MNINISFEIDTKNFQVKDQTLKQIRNARYLSFTQKQLLQL